MKISKRQLRKIIKEEKAKLINEQTLTPELALDIAIGTLSEVILNHEAIEMYPDLEDNVNDVIERLTIVQRALPLK